MVVIKHTPKAVRRFKSLSFRRVVWCGRSVESEVGKWLSVQSPSEGLMIEWPHEVANQIRWWAYRSNVSSRLVLKSPWTRSNVIYLLLMNHGQVVVPWLKTTLYQIETIFQALATNHTAEDLGRNLFVLTVEVCSVSSSSWAIYRRVPESICPSVVVCPVGSVRQVVNYPRYPLSLEEYY